MATPTLTAFALQGGDDGIHTFVDGNHDHAFPVEVGRVHC